MAADAGSVVARAATARGVAFLALLTWILGGPLAVQVLGVGGDLSRYLRPWEMFSGRGSGVIEARYFERLPDGELRELDRFRLLGHADRHAGPSWMRLIQGEAHTKKIGVALCAALGPGADVRIVSRRASRNGWAPSHRGTERICPGAPP